DSSHVVVVGNFGLNAQSSTVVFPVAGTWFDYLRNTTFTATGGMQTVSLLPGEYRVFVNRNVNNIAVTPVSNVPWNGQWLDAKAFPNPVATSKYKIEVNIPQSGKLTVELYNSIGQYVTTVYDEFLIKGTHQLSIDNKFPKGNYYLNLKTKTATKTIPVTIQ
ncbi:MAG TPA: T9SS type A sorting domain-containing protein, partial [Flavisolibacter sp.]